MSCQRFGLLAVALLAAGCVPTTEPLSDANKAEPDKNLVGEWKHTGGALGTDMVIDIPAVKGNPKGLMRSGPKGGPEKDAPWFFPTTIEKKTYANCIVARTGGVPNPTFGKEGEFAARQKGDKRAYWIFQYTLSGDELVIDGGDGKAFERLGTAEQFEKAGTIFSTPAFFVTPAEWLAKHLAKNGPATIYDGSNKTTYKRVKK